MNSQIIHIDFEPFFYDHIRKDIVHECLEHWWGITETKEHDSGLKKVEGGNEHGLPLVFLPNVNVIVSPLL